MRSMGRALGAALVIGTLFVPYARPLFCTMGTAPVSSPDHGNHDMAQHTAPGAQWTVPGTSTVCHAAPSCGLTHAGPLQAGTTLLADAASTTARQGNPLAGPSALQAPTTPPPRS